ncbi:hypothetical protein SYJ56_23580 [Algoriphagus sp. D3-2-R+10]|uniref:hypothetical protein n=1 Tax=Algoriphagus aurantiacus TaxID=3103948 RepID=UPI002B3D0341|nr:hypothetical protein [Algoriphagus sp. D3-2-R+10]MEB2778312.1 hypothetical protein [Algoriphagus sp. D3-2-R+10]
MTRNTIGAVVVTFKRPIQLVKTLEAILEQGILQKHIWVINNDIGDKLEIVRTLFPEINIFQSMKNIASAGGFSLGMIKIFQCGLEWAWLFNDDSRPIGGSLDSILDHAETLDQPDAGMVKLANLNKRGEAVLQYWNGRRLPAYVPVSQKLIATDLVTFDACLVSVKMISEIGTCDPGYFMGTYEFDYCLLAKDHGFQIYTIPNGMIEDEKSGSIGGTPPWRQYYNTRNHLHLGIKRKDTGIIWAWMVREAKFTYSILRFQDQKLKRLKLKFYAFFHAMVGIRGKVFDPENS